MKAVLGLWFPVAILLCATSVCIAEDLRYPDTSKYFQVSSCLFNKIHCSRKKELRTFLIIRLKILLVLKALINTTIKNLTIKTFNHFLQGHFLSSKRTKPSLSIVNPLDVLRQRIILEMARRQMRENTKQVSSKIIL